MKERNSEMRRIAVWGAVVLLLFGLGEAAHSEVVVLQPGSEGEDVSPYQFLPASFRGGNESLWAFTDPEGVHSFRTFIQFDLPPDLLAPDEEIGSALLVLLFDREIGFGMSSGDGPGVLECRPALAAWSEATVTWTAQPAFGDPVDVVDDIDAFGDVACDVTMLVADWADGLAPNHGFALTNPTDRLIGFPSSDATIDGEPDPQRPRLLINVVPVPEPRGEVAAVLVLLSAVRRRRAMRPCRPVSAP